MEHGGSLGWLRWDAFVDPTYQSRKSALEAALGGRGPRSGAGGRARTRLKCVPCAPCRPMRVMGLDGKARRLFNVMAGVPRNREKKSETVSTFVGAVTILRAFFVMYPEARVVLNAVVYFYDQVTRQPVQASDEEQSMYEDQTAEEPEEEEEAEEV